MIYVPVILFAFAFLAGLKIVANKFAGKHNPLMISFFHGVFFATGLAVLIINVILYEAKILTLIALALFLATAIGELVLFVLNLKKKQILPALILLDGIGNAIAFVILSISLYSYI